MGNGRGVGTWGSSIMIDVDATERIPARPRLVAARVATAKGPLRRLQGLLGRSELDPDEGLVLRPCRRVHTFGMRFPVDVLLCDRESRVLAVETLPPGRTSSRLRGVRCCIELAAGTARRAGVRPGARLELVGTELSAIEDGP